jgi:outer membrane protein assembly factor BamB
LHGRGEKQEISRQLFGRPILLASRCEDLKISMWVNDTTGQRRVGMRNRFDEKDHLMKSSDLVFIGIKGSVIALDRATGQQVWATHLKGSDFVNLLVQDDAVIASCGGEIFSVDAFTGNAHWHNPLKGFGIGLATIATAQNPGSGNAVAEAEKRRRDQQSAGAGAAVVSTTV